MKRQSKRTNRTIVVDFQDEATYHHLCQNGRAFMMKGFHHQEGSKPKFVNSLAILYNLVPYQRRARHTGQCGIQVQGGKLPTNDWFLNLQILTCGGFQ